MRWPRDGVMVPTRILEAATLRPSVMPVCRCGHIARFEAHGVWWHFERRAWDDSLTSARDHFWCRICRSRQQQKVRPVRLELTLWQEGDVELPWPDDHTWKRATARLR